MSKYFNESQRLRSTTVFDDILRPVPENGAAPPAVPTRNAAVEPLPFPETAMSDAGAGLELPAVEQEKYRTIQLPLEKLPRAQFKDGRSLEAAEESYRALRTRLLRIKTAQGIRSVVITSASQGDGKTLTSLNLGLCCAQMHDLRVLLVDADVRNCGLSRAIESPEGLGLADVLTGNCTPEQAVLQTDRPNLCVVASGTATTAAAELFASGRWSEFVNWSKGKFDLILVDSPPALSLSDVELITAGCEGVLLVVRARYTRRETLQKCVRQVDAKKLLGVVYNGVQEGSHHRYRYKKYGRYGKD